VLANKSTEGQTCHPSSQSLLPFWKSHLAGGSFPSQMTEFRHFCFCSREPVSGANWAKALPPLGTGHPPARAPKHPENPSTQGPTLEHHTATNEPCLMHLNSDPQLTRCQHCHQATHSNKNPPQLTWRHQQLGHQKVQNLSLHRLLHASTKSNPLLLLLSALDVPGHCQHVLHRSSKPCLRRPSGCATAPDALATEFIQSK